MGTGDYNAKPVKTLKGPHTVRIQIKHASTDVLMSINDMPMLLQRSLKTPVNLSFFLTQSDALVGTNKLTARSIPPGGSVSFYYREPNSDQIPKGALPGDTLSGKVTYLIKEKSRVGCGIKPGGYDVKYVIGDTKPVAAATTTATPTTTSASTTSPVTIIVDADTNSTPVVPANTIDPVLVNPGAVSTPVTPASTSEKIDLKETEKEKEKEKENEKESGIDKYVRNAKTKYLKNEIGNPTTFDSLYITVETAYPKDLALKLVALSHTVKCQQAALEAVKRDCKAETIGEYITVNMICLSPASSLLLLLIPSTSHLTFIRILSSKYIVRDEAIHTNTNDIL